MWRELSVHMLPYRELRPLQRSPQCLLQEKSWPSFLPGTYLLNNSYCEIISTMSFFCENVFYTLRLSWKRGCPLEPTKTHNLDHQANPVILICDLLSCDQWFKDAPKHHILRLKFVFSLSITGPYLSIKEKANLSTN